jgi:hypothetical protein
VHLAALDGLVNDLIPSLTALAQSLERKAEEFAHLVKSGRTHLMDAVPVTLGQEFGGYAAQVRQGIARLESTLERVGQIPLGGTATGTGLNTHPEFAERVRARIAADTGLTVLPPADPFEAQAARDALVEASGALKTVAVSLTKIATTSDDGSGPRAGLAEIACRSCKGRSCPAQPVIPEATRSPPGDRQRPGDYRRRPPGPFRAERVRADDGAEPPAVDQAPRERIAAPGGEVRGRHHREPRAVRAVRGADVVGGDRAQPVDRL